MPRRTPGGPSPASVRTARSNRTGSRRLPYQYARPPPGPASLPGHRRDHRDPRRPGAIPASAARTRRGAPPPARSARRSPPAAPGPHAPRRALGGQLGQRVRRPRAPRWPRAVHRRHRQPAPPAGQPLADPGCRLGHRHHPAPPGQRGQRLAAQRDDLAPRRPATGSRPHTPPRSRPANGPTTASGVTPAACHTRGQRHHHRPQRRLHHLHPVQIRTPRPRSRRPAASPRAAPAPRAHSASRAANTGDDAASPGPSRPTGRPARGTRTPTFPGRPSAAPVTTPRRGLPRRHRRQPRQQLRLVRADHHRPVLERRPGGRQRPAHIRRIQARPRRQHSASRPAWPASAAAGPRRHQPRHERPAGQHRGPPEPRRDGCRRRRGRSGPSAGGRLLEDDVGVGAAEPERGHPGPARAARVAATAPPRSPAAPRRPPSPRAGTARPRAAWRARCRAASPATILITPATPAAAWVWPMLDFTDPSQQRPARGAVLPVGRQQRLRLDRVAQRGSPSRAPRPRPPRPPTARRWPAPARITRCCDGPFGAVSPLLRPVLVHRAARHHRQHPVPVAARVREPLQHQHPRALGPAGAVGGIRERLAPAVGGQPPLPRELDERHRRGHHRHPARQRQRALPGPQRLARQVQRDQRRGARRVDRDRRALPGRARTTTRPGAPRWTRPCPGSPSASAGPRLRAGAVVVVR